MYTPPTLLFFLGLILLSISILPGITFSQEADNQNPTENSQEIDDPEAISSEDIISEDISSEDIFSEDIFSNDTEIPDYEDTDSNTSDSLDSDTSDSNTSEESAETQSTKEHSDANEIFITGQNKLADSVFRLSFGLFMPVSKTIRQDYGNSWILHVEYNTLFIKFIHAYIRYSLHTHSMDLQSLAARLWGHEFAVGAKLFLDIKTPLPQPLRIYFGLGYKLAIMVDKATFEPLADDWKADEYSAIESKRVFFPMGGELSLGVEYAFHPHAGVFLDGFLGTLGGFSNGEDQDGFRVMIGGFYKI